MTGAPASRRPGSCRPRGRSGPGCGFSPGRNWSGRMPIPTRFVRWIRSNVSAMAARTPSRSGPFAAQSRDDPEPYSLPAMTSCGASDRYRPATSKMKPSSPSGRWTVRPLALARERVAEADVAERPPHQDLVVAAPLSRVELQRAHAVLEPLARRGPRDDGAGREMWSVVTEIARTASTRAPTDVGRRLGRHRQALEERRPRHVRRGGVPVVAVAGRDRQGLPAVVPVEHARVRPTEARGRSDRG